MGIFDFLLLLLAAWFLVWLVLGCLVVFVGFPYLVFYAALVEKKYPSFSWHPGLHDD